MALTADQITAQNFKDFYTQILPYLNKGNGGTSDTPIGQVAFFDDLVAPYGWLVADGSTYNISDYPDLANQYERVHGSKNYYGGDGTTTFAVPDWDAIPTEVFGNSNIICIKAIPSSEMNTYSLTERRVGTWIDGKPLYEKTIVTDKPVYNNGHCRVNIGASIDVVVKEHHEMITLDGVANACNCLRSIDSGTVNHKVTVVTNTNQYHPNTIDYVSCDMASFTGQYTMYSTIQYTKTTDV